MTGEQVRAARALLGWTQHQLAERADIGFRSVRRIEAGQETSHLVSSALRRVLRDAGVVAFAEAGELSELDLAGGVALLRSAASGSVD